MLPVTLTQRGRGLWNDPFQALHQDLDTLLGLRRVGDGNGADGTLIGHYPVDIREDDNHVYVEAEMPGFKRDEVEVVLDSGVLTLRAERKTDARPAGAEHLSERRYTRVQRCFTLPTSVDESKVNAKLADGVLHITLDKREEVKPRRIEVK